MDICNIRNNFNRFWDFYHGTNVTSWVLVHPRPHMAPLVLRPRRKFVVYLDLALHRIILHLQKAIVLKNIILTQKKVTHFTYKNENNNNNNNNNKFLGVFV
jgi:hypothetical protein